MDSMDSMTIGSLLLTAEKIVENYCITIEKDKKYGFKGSSLELPDVSANGKTIEKCYEAAKRALTTKVAIMIKSGKKPPEPSSTKKRTKQVNMRITPYEKILLTETASNNGFDGISNFIRHIVFEQIRQSP